MLACTMHVHYVNYVVRCIYFQIETVETKSVGAGLLMVEKPRPEANENAA